jgi:hypothetical protein
MRRGVSRPPKITISEAITHQVISRAVGMPVPLLVLAIGFAVALINSTLYSTL